MSEAKYFIAMADVMTLFAAVWMLLYTPLQEKTSGYSEFVWYVEFVGDVNPDDMTFSRARFDKTFSMHDDQISYAVGRNVLEIFCVRYMGALIDVYADPLSDYDFTRLKEALAQQPSTYVYVLAENGTTSCVRQVNEQLMDQFDGELHFRLLSGTYKWVE